MDRTTRWLLFLPLLMLLALAPVLATAEDQEAPDATPAYEPKTLAPSWRDQATAAYGEKRYADAIFLYRKWLEADPHDDASWQDPRWPTADSDLEPIRADPRFGAAVARCVENQAKDGPRDAVRHWVEVPAVTTYLALLPPDYPSSEAEYPLVLILHGNGSSEAWHGRIADTVGREGVIYVAPRAPYPNAQVFYQLQRPGWTWLPQDIDEVSTERLDARKRYRVAEPVRELLRTWIREVVRSL